MILSLWFIYTRVKRFKENYKTARTSEIQHWIFIHFFIQLWSSVKFSYFVKCFIDNVLFIWIRNLSKIFRNSNYCIYNITFILCTINYTFYNLNIKLVARNESKKHGWKVTGLSHYNIFKLWRLVLSHFLYLR